ncbi:MAG: flagellar hook-basal body complex protein FliE [Cyanobacteria bacterium SIG31]|nr:flagellar hook-basal body complex protein FliE [Cyanobacteria bacterium SIG31]
MSMDFSTSIQGFNREFNLNAVRDYNNFLQKQDSFEFDNDVTEFSKALDTASKSVPLRDKTDPTGMGSFMDKIGSSLGGGLDAVNRAKLEADRMQEDLAMGGATSIHDAMIAAEKAQLSMQMAVQIRNRILTAYTEINSMGL